MNIHCLLSDYQAITLEKYRTLLHINFLQVLEILQIKAISCGSALSLSPWLYYCYLLYSTSLT